MTKIGRNQPCPCGSGKKFKYCHDGTGVDFNNLNNDEFVRQLSVRGKNLLFINNIADALQLNTVKQPKSFLEFVKQIKKSLTPQAVRNIHLAIPEIWPDGKDLERCMLAEKDSQSGLFLGRYQYNVTTQLLNRHALYDKSLILLDPIHDPRTMASKYNPVLKPEKHIVTTFQYVLLWLQLIPWIEKGIVKIIRDPGDFDYQLRKNTIEKSQKRSNSKELSAALLKAEKEMSLAESSFGDQFYLSHPDEYWFDKLCNDKTSKESVSKFLKNKREQSTFYIDVGTQSQIMASTSGTNYEMGKYICDVTGSHIITDIDYRWKEMEYDRQVNGVHIDEWSPFAKAIQGSELKHLNGVSLNDLLKLRDDGYLEDMRLFLRRVWTSCSSGNSFDKNNIENLSAEMTEHINKAETEWKAIDSNLIKWFGSESILGAAIGISAASAGWIPAAATVASAGVVNLYQSNRARHRFTSRYPAAFFIKSIRNKN